MLLKCILSPSSPLVTICTSGFKVENSAFCPHSVCMFFCTGLRTSSDYFLKRNWFTGFYNRRSAHCAVRTEYLNIMEVFFLSVKCYCWFLLKIAALVRSMQVLPEDGVRYTETYRRSMVWIRNKYKTCIYLVWLKRFVICEDSRNGMLKSNSTDVFYWIAVAKKWTHYRALVDVVIVNLKLWKAGYQFPLLISPKYI